MNQSKRDLRRAYLERYTQERITWASQKASYHKSRAKKRGCTEHFTGWEWLDLCETFGWCCSLCKQSAPLPELHHRHELHLGGSNTIDNVEPLCQRCHDYRHDGPEDASDFWMAKQAELLASFHEGDRVRLQRPRQSLAVDAEALRGKAPFGVITQLIPAQRGSFPLRGWTASDGVMDVSLNNYSEDWLRLRARACVRWTSSEAAEPVVYLNTLTRAGGRRGKMA